jgi:hypothetical protein
MKRALLLVVLLLGCKSDKEKCLASNMEENLPVCEKVCATDDADACHQAAYINTAYMHPKEANTFYKKACKLGRKESCDYVR